MITTIDEFVSKGGGVKATAKLFGVVRNAPWNWVKRRHFPGWAVPRAMEIAQANGWVIAPELITASKPKKRRSTKSNGRAVSTRITRGKRPVRVQAAE
jgi:hypothetical protein